VVELYPDQAPAAVARFLEASGADGKGSGAYRGSRVCESRAGGFLVLGCPAVGGAPAGGPWPDEIDAAALGLEARRLDDPAERQLLWQREIVPRYVKLRQAGRPVPEGLASLVAALRERGEEATILLEGRTRRWYLEALGYRYRRGASDRPVTRGALATPNLWPGEADGRFLIALADLPERDGRGTVFGRVVEGLEVLDALAARPVDKSHRPLEPIPILDLRPVPAGALDSAPSGGDGKDATP
jgi:cyclophilin family peptidyl-prolyl cis-trans isomerase